MAIALRAGPLTLSLTDTGDEAVGWWDPDRRLITLHPQLTPESMRCTLLHELIHAARGHEGHDDSAEVERREAEVEAEVARILVPARNLRRVLQATGDHEVRMRRLGVDPGTLEAALARLSA